MSSLRELAEVHTPLHPAEVDQLAAVVADWQILADLSFSDLLLFIEDDDNGDLLVAAQMRPYTAQTIYYEDLIGQRFRPADRPNVARSLASGRIVRDGDPDWSMGVPVREEAIPVLFDGQVIGVVTREANLSMVRAPSQLELTYLQSADEISQMLATGAFPYPVDKQDRDLSPRVGDGLMRIDPRGNVVYASPNAISAYRRLGVVDNIIGAHLSDFDLDDDAIIEALKDGEPLESEVEARGIVVLRRMLPLTKEHEVLGSLMLLREVTELRRQQRLLQVKDATIREIHHRVKNNLQTVASLLRLQSRRLESEEARLALGESVRRIASIALVHETLSQDSRLGVSFDKIAQRLVDMLSSGLTSPDHPVQMAITGTAGELEAEVATPLALVLSELLQNCVEHAFPSRSGHIQVRLERGVKHLTMRVVDDGVGLPEGWTLEGSSHLGLRIAATLVETEMFGELTVAPHPDHVGTQAVARVLLAPPTAHDEPVSLHQG